MKKLCMGFFAFMLIFIEGICPAFADDVSINRMIAGNLQVNVDVVPPQRQAYPAYHIEYMDLTQSEALNARALADMLFHDQQSERSYEESRDPQYREGGDSVENRAGEYIFLTQSGMVAYSLNEGDQPYELALWRVLSTYCYDQDIIPMDGAALHRDLPFASRDQVLNAVEPLIDAFANACGLTADLADCLSVDHSFLQKNTSLLPSFNGVNPKEYTADWDEDEDMYLLVYGFSQDELPILRFLETDHTLISQSPATASSIYIVVYVNSGGIYSLEARVAELSLLEKEQPILAPEKALDHLEGYMEQLILEQPTQIVRMYLRYLPLKTSKSLSEGKLIPVWCFAAMCEGGYLPQVYLLNAFTGELLP